MKFSDRDLRLRRQQVGDAKRFFEILTHPDFTLFPVTVNSIEEEKRFLRTNRRQRANHYAYNYAILLNNMVVGGIGLKIDQHRPYIGEVGYFVERKLWGKGIVPRAVALIEKIGFDELGLERIELVALKANRASMRVAEKCGYRKEGILRHKQLHEDKFQYACLFAKIKTDYR